MIYHTIFFHDDFAYHAQKVLVEGELTEGQTYEYNRATYRVKRLAPNMTGGMTADFHRITTITEVTRLNKAWRVFWNEILIAVGVRR